MKPSIIRLRALEKQLYAYLYAMTVIDFDAETVAPEGSADGRAGATEVLSRASFDLLVNDGTAALLKEAAADAFDLLAQDLEQNIKEGTSTLPFPEQYRVMFEGIPCWPKLPNLFKPLKENGINVTAVVYAPAFGFVYNNMDEMARAYYKAPNSVCIEQGVAWREGICRDNKVDGVLVHYNRSCKPWSGYMAEMQRRFTKDLGVPCAGFDGDQADPRNFNEAQYETRVQGLVEAMEANKAAKEGAEK